MRRMLGKALRVLQVSIPFLGVAAQGASDHADRVEIRRTAHGVPHLLARDFTALGYGMAWVQLEDYGATVGMGFVEARGHMGRYYGRDSLDRDFGARLSHARAAATWNALEQDTRDIFEGFASGTNAYIASHRSEFPAWMPADFTGQDAAALWMESPMPGVAGTYARRAARQRQMAADSARRAGEGSNAWAFAPSRTKSGKAILLRNPHLDWSAGYYEMHVTIPGRLNFYGDFRIGNPALLVGGFNEHLGFATTNNNTDNEVLYSLEADPQRVDHYLFDGKSIPLERVTVTAEYKNGASLASETREFWRSELGPVVERADGRIIVASWPAEGEFRKTEEFLRMMKARTLEEWKSAVKLRAHTTSNLTYADKAGNIFYIFNATTPRLPHASGADSMAIPVRGRADVWQEVIAFDSLPQVLNPPGGYLQNSNDPFHHTNLNAVIDSTRFGSNFPRPRMGFRTQLGLQLVTQEKKVSLEDVVRLKHSSRMLAADRFKDDLLAAAKARSVNDTVAAAVRVLERWNNTVEPSARGGVLFEAWYRRYLEGGEALRGRPQTERWNAVWATKWSPASPTTTPDGLADPDRAVRDLAWAATEVTRRWGSVDVPWGDVNRLRRGGKDVPSAGCDGVLGCFRVLWFIDAPDGKRVARGGDGWVIAVEFGDVPRAYSILAYGQSSRPESPHHTDQLEMFSRGEMKRVLFTAKDVEAGTVRRYHPR
ncbi:MAG: penicillin acylase family protein [Cytophagaceae bacterium]|nr:penicillin acylase family protein [Gemmatimonadaceae bacterium]